jgi:hypothetical protein
MLAAFKAELRQQISSTAAGEHVMAPGVVTARGPEPLEVTLHAAVAEADPTTSASKELVVATPTAGVLPTSEAQSEGLHTRIPHQGEDDQPNGGGGHRGHNVRAALRLSPRRCVVLPAWLWRWHVGRAPGCVGA